jgi:hypothetical protein
VLFAVAGGEITGSPSFQQDRHEPVLRIRIRYPGSGAFLTPGSGIQEGKKVRIRIRDELPGSNFLELNHFFGLKYLNSLIRIRDGQNLDPGWKKVGSGINIPDPQHWHELPTTFI